MSFLTDDASTRNSPSASAFTAPSSSRHAPASPTHLGRSTASAFDIPGHAIHLANPQRLSVLSISINATTTIVTTPASLPFANAAVSSTTQASRPPLSPSAYRNASTSKLNSPQPPPSSFQNHTTKSSRSRPLSHDFGQKARDVLSEFGRLASRRASAMERAGGAETLARVADGLNPPSHSQSHNRRASFHPMTPAGHSNGSLPSSTAATSQSLKPPHMRLISDEGALTRFTVTQRLTLVPQGDPRLLSSSVPLAIQSRISGSGVLPAESAPIVFTADPNDDSRVQTEATSNASRSSASFDPSRLLLKVSPPIELARNAWAREVSSSAPSHGETSEENTVDLRFRLRLEAPAANTSSGTILFLSASSTSRLIEAIESPQSSIATAELASLEGIVRVEVPPPTSLLSASVSRGARDCDFDWAWKSLARTASNGSSRCCCAFVELRPHGMSATVLAAFSFFVETPSTGNALATGIHSPSKAGMSRSDSLALIAALDLGQDLSMDSDLALSSPALQAGPVSADASPAPKSSYFSSQASIPSMSIDRTELALEDVVSDSPIFRAALVNLERRTASIKRLSKAMLKAAQDTQARMAKLIESEDAMDAAFDDLVSMAPETLGRMQDHFLRQARASVTQRHREHVATIDACLERPLLQMIELCRVAQDGFKLFDNESKSYYSNTQKWLANRSSADASQPHSDPTYPAAIEKAHKQERADEKQKLRELRFEQARLDLFLMLQRLHGGKAEANLAQRILQLSWWFAKTPRMTSGTEASDEESNAFLLALGAALQNALDGHALQLDQAEARSRLTGDKIRALEMALGRSADIDVDIVGAHRFEVEQETPQVQNQGGAVASKARKFKSLLGAFALGINSTPLSASKSNSPNPASVASQQEPETNAHNANEASSRPAAQRRLSLKLRSERDQLRDTSPASPLRAQAPSSWKYGVLDAAPRRGSEIRDPSSSGDLDGTAHPSPTVAAPDAAAGSSDCGLGIYAPSSPRSPRSVDPATMLPPAASGAAIAAPNLGGDRKKEGVLWVMSKPISGPAGADAPRGVSRSTYWRECWVVLSGSGQVSEFADWKNAKALETTNPLIDLRFATVREARGVDRRFTFEIVTRDSRRFFQAPDEESMRDWMRAISKAIESLLNGTSSVRKLDRAVRASPFGNLDSAPRAGAFDEKEEDAGVTEGDDFAVRRLLDRSGKQFSQSMTDLSSSGKAQSGERKGERTRIGGHLVTLSESQAEPAAQHSKRKSQHQRGISNKTPISGYLGGGGLGLSAADAAAWHRRSGTAGSDDASSSSLSAKDEHETEFDRQIEAVVHRSYGSHDESGMNRSGFSHISAPAGVDEMGMLKGNPPRRSTAPNTGYKSSTVNGSVASTAFSTKESRAAELAAISRRPENRRCADCASSDPRWASWMLANEACCIFICIGCSGVHRSLGVHISKVKSVDLDDWTEEQLQAARDWGNLRANALWEHSKPPGRLPASGDRSEFWRIKYVDQQWKAPPDEASAPDHQSPKVVQPGLTGVHADRQDIDATPTRRSVAPPSSPPSTVYIISSDQQGRTSGAGAIEALGSPRPIGPRPLPSRRSVSMQSVPTTSPPQSSVGPGRTFGAARDLATPVSPTKRAIVDWKNSPAAVAINSPGSQHRRVASVTEAHVSAAMLAARADPRLFPDAQLARAGEYERISSPPSSYFVSNLDGSSPSPIFFEDEASPDRRTSVGSPPNPPARFDAYASAH